MFGEKVFLVKNGMEIVDLAEKNLTNEKLRILIEYNVEQRLIGCLL
ncbi:MAG: hypothetical protein Q8S24_11850 [Eubacteriales bacterium]|nr:hypothetical protein [Eubacteriales bacterium]